MRAAVTKVASDDLPGPIPVLAGSPAEADQDEPALPRPD